MSLRDANFDLLQKRQSGVFFDDIGAEGEDTTGESEIEDVAGNESGVEVAD